jgi:flagellar protein FliO/FliZ
MAQEGIGTAVLWFVAVVAAVPVLLWLLRRSPMGARLAGPRVGPVRTVATLALTPQQRLVTVEIGQGEERRWLVLGVTPGSINLVTSMAPQEAAPSATGANAGTPAEGFAQLLSRLKSGGAAT